MPFRELADFPAGPGAAVKDHAFDLLSLLPVSLAMVEDGRHLLLSERMVQTYGYTIDEVPTVDAWFDAVYPDPDYRDSLRTSWACDLATLGPTGAVDVRFPVSITCKDGTVRLSHVQIVAIGMGRLLVTFEDVTARVAALDALAASEQRLRMLIESAPVAVLVARDGLVAYHNPAFCQLAEMEPGESMVGRGIADLASPGHRERVVELLEGADRSLTSSAEFETTNGADADRPITVHVSATRMMFGEGPATVLFLTDVSERARSERAIRRANAQLEARVVERTGEIEASNERLRFANDRLLAVVEELERVNAELDRATHAKSDFLANMSHELRTPLNSILGFSGLLLDGMAGPMSDEQSRQIGMVNASGHHLLALVNDALDLSRIEAEQEVLCLEEVDAAGILRKSVATAAPMADEKGLSLTGHAAADAGAIRTDARRVEQILLNLLSNAVKFTDRGAVAADVSREHDAIVFSVSDTGRGIASDDLDHIFEEFYQSREAGAAKPEGTGLGLALSRRLARMLGGDVSVCSQVGRGSTFTVRLPVSSPEE